MDIFLRTEDKYNFAYKCQVFWIIKIKYMGKNKVELTGILYTSVDNIKVDSFLNEFELYNYKIPRENLYELAEHFELKILIFIYDSLKSEYFNIVGTETNNYLIKDLSNIVLKFI